MPLGSGLSSSAAFGVACALALSEAAGAPVTGTELALVAQRAEHLAGVPCGVMDQMASVHGRRGHALLLDCRTLTAEAIPLPPDLAVVVVYSGMPRRLAGSEYARRREACAAAAARLHVAALRDASAVDVSDDPFARHVVSENERVVEFARALRGDDRTELGALMNASHASLRDDFAVSTPELDTLVGVAARRGCTRRPPHRRGLRRLGGRDRGPRARRGDHDRRGRALSCRDRPRTDRVRHHRPRRGLRITQREQRPAERQKAVRP